MMSEPILSLLKKKYWGQALVLMYHRIIDVDNDPWELAVSPQNFEAHLQVLQDYKVISIQKLDVKLKNKKRFLKKTVSLTFDDGYLDNYQNALPLLEKYATPATFFITTESTEKKEEFWWDALERICFHTANLPTILDLKEPEIIHWEIGITDDVKAGKITSKSLYFELCNVFKGIDSAQRDTLLENLKLWSGNGLNRPYNLTMNKAELLKLQSNSLFTVGAHTVSHPFLPALSYDYQKKEVEDNINYLEKLLGERINFLAYPHGGYNGYTLQLASILELKLAFTTEEKLVDKNVNPFQIPRFQVKNWDGITFENKLKNWLNNNDESNK